MRSPLAFIAFAAGSELELAHVRSSLRAILAILLGQTIVVLILGAIAYVLLADAMPFMQGMAPAAVLAIALIGATIMVARSPSSALAIIKEMRGARAVHANYPRHHGIDGRGRHHHLHRQCVARRRAH